MTRTLRCDRCGVQWTHPTPDRYQATRCWLCGQLGTPVDDQAARKR